MSYQNLEEGDALLESSEVTITTVTTPSTSKKIIALCATIVLALGSVALLYKPLDMTPVTSTALAYLPEESKAYYNGRRYAVLGGASASAMNYKCMSGWNEMPDGYVIKYPLLNN
jgi:thioredoxin reductase